VVTENVLNNRDDVFVQAATVDIDIEDFQFSANGITIFFETDESSATPPAACPYVPDPIWAEWDILLANQGRGRSF
jgi:hypothetical protein